MASEIKRRFTDPEMQIAKETDLPELLTHLGYQVRRIGRYHTTAEMDSLRIKDRRYKDKDGNKLTDFISIKVRGPLAERCAAFAWKGCKLAAAGDFETITFADDPQRQPGFLIKASDVEFLSPRKAEETAQELEDESVREVAA